MKKNESANTHSRYSFISKSSICAVVVTCQPDTGLPMRIEPTARQVDKVIIVDNGSSETCLKMLKEISISHDAYLITNVRNRGVATALNQGLEFAGKCGYKWILTLDDDSVPSDTMLDEMIAAFGNYPEKDKVGIIGANPIDSETRRTPYKDKCDGRGWIEEKVLITSGCLMPFTTFEKIGPLKDEFFIDCVDQEYCLRIRSFGGRVILACRAHLTHSLGHPRKHKLLWREVAPTNHSHVRRYFITRNRLVVIKKYFFGEPAWAIQQLIGLSKSLILVMLLEVDKRKKLASAAIGAWHGLIGKMGQYFSDEVLNSCRPQSSDSMRAN